MIDITKAYRTRSGKRVIGLTYQEFGSAGNRVTFPIKGSIVVKEKPLKLVYTIWTEDGLFQASKLWGPNPNDLIPEAETEENP